jgi:RNA polymerase sigma-70 factor (ECF subfamily)
LTEPAQPNADALLSELEAEALATWKQGDYRATASLLLEAYGGELRSYLLARVGRSQSIADEVFSEFLEDFWRGLPDFQWRCSARGWCYILLRNAATRFQRSPQNRRARQERLTGSLDDAQLMERARTQTREYEKTEVKDRFQALRERLPVDDQDLLILRINRKLAWREVALILLESSAPFDEEVVRRKAQALRRRLVETIRQLRKMAEDSGLLGSSE